MKTTYTPSLQHRTPSRINDYNYRYPLISFLIVGYKSEQYLEEFFKALQGMKFEKGYIFEIIIYDANNKINSSLYRKHIYDFTKATNWKLNNINYDIKGHDSISSLSGQPASYCQAINYLAKCARGKWLWIINPDTYLKFPEQFNQAFFDNLEENKYHVSAYNFLIQGIKDGNKNGGADYINLLGGFDPTNKSYAMITLTGTSFIINRSCWNYLGGFNELYIMYGEEVDMSLKMLMLDMDIRMLPNNYTIMHHGGGSQEIPLEQFSPERRFLALRNNALIWGANANNLFWGFYIIRLFLIWVEYLYVRKSFWDTYWRAFIEAITWLPQFRKSTNRNRVYSEFRILRKYLKFTFKIFNR